MPYPPFAPTSPPPAGRRTPSARPPNSVDGLAAGPPVLLIDDVSADAADSRTALETAHYAVVEAADGDAALRLVRATLMRCVVSELYIPCREGPCVIAALRGDRDRLPQVRVLAYTRHHAGADGVLHKPASVAVR